MILTFEGGKVTLLPGIEKQVVTIHPSGTIEVHADGSVTIRTKEVSITGQQQPITPVLGPIVASPAYPSPPPFGGFARPVTEYCGSGYDTTFGGVAVAQAALMQNAVTHPVSNHPAMVSALDSADAVVEAKGDNYHQRPDGRIDHFNGLEKVKQDPGSFHFNADAIKAMIALKQENDGEDLFKGCYPEWDNDPVSKLHNGTLQPIVKEPKTRLEELWDEFNATADDDDDGQLFALTKYLVEAEQWAVISEMQIAGIMEHDVGDLISIALVAVLGHEAELGRKRDLVLCKKKEAQQARYDKIEASVEQLQAKVAMYSDPSPEMLAKMDAVIQKLDFKAPLKEFERAVEELRQITIDADNARCAEWRKNQVDIDPTVEEPDVLTAGQKLELEEQIRRDDATFEMMSNIMESLNPEDYEDHVRKTKVLQELANQIGKKPQLVVEPTSALDSVPAGFNEPKEEPKEEPKSALDFVGYGNAARFDNDHPIGRGYWSNLDSRFVVGRGYTTVERRLEDEQKVKDKYAKRVSDAEMARKLLSGS